ncbi:MAG: methyl-accepting chemotaxis protein [Desulfobulbaceae bacterium]|nr:methyl-accepting chemotaxis protein [Desulfobulbaceae bacterium]
MFKDMSISRKLLVSFAAVLLLTVIVGYAGYSGMASIADRADKISRYKEMVAELLNARQQEKNYIMRRDDSYIPKVEEQIAATKAAANELKTLHSKQDDKDRLSAIVQQIDEYAAAFHAFVELRNQKNAIMEEMRGEAGKALELAGKSNAERISVMLLDARKSEKEFIISNEAKWLQGVEEGVKSARSAAAAAGLGSLADSIAAYKQHFDKFVALTAEQGKAEEKMVAEAQQAMKGCGEAEAAQSKKMVSDTAKADTTLITVSLLALAIGVGLALLISRALSQPIAKAMHMLEEMSKGHLNLRLNLERADEIGRMAKTMDSFADSLQKEMVAALDKLADGDLTFDATPHDEADAIRNALKKTGDDLNKLITEILTATEQVTSGAGQVSDSSQALSQGATEQAASLEEITSSMTEMASQTKLNAENATQANHLANQTKSAAEGGNARMQEMVKAMNEINEAGQNISKIIKVIDEIAFQTNLLALNAAVEAARAGRHGKGFAVVAEEVRNLAARSAKAAKETAELIEGSVEKTRNGTAIAQSTSEALSEIVSSVTKVTDLVGEIAAASNEQAQGINQANQALSQIDQVTQQNTASAEESAAASEELSGQAMHMKEMMSRFKVRDMGQRYGRQQTSPQTGQGKPASQGWGTAPQSTKRQLSGQSKEPHPSEIIALDDKEFGK